MGLSIQVRGAGEKRAIFSYGYNQRAFFSEVQIGKRNFHARDLSSV
jgi:hypothetical protein